MKLQTILVIAALSAAGCIDQAPTSQQDPDGMTDFGSASDLRVDDAGDTPDVDLEEVRASAIFRQFEAVWTFEEGMVSVRNNHELSDDSRMMHDSAPQGAYQLDLDGTISETKSEPFGDLIDGKLLVGGWVRMKAQRVTSIIISQMDSDGGWALGVDGGEWACSGSTGINANPTPVLSGVPATQEWTHVACLFGRSGNMVRVRIYVNGVSTKDDFVPYAPSGRFTLGMEDTAYRFSGSVDEVFVAYPADEEAPLVRRLYACGADGELCTCNPREHNQFEDCGRLGSEDCSGLSVCSVSADF